jgi:hypothetical protein
MCWFMVYLVTFPLGYNMQWRILRWELEINFHIMWKEEAI